jgi:hypothetical protein
MERSLSVAGLGGRDVNASLRVKDWSVSSTMSGPLAEGGENVSLVAIESAWRTPWMSRI